jgi:molybdopterin-guanine dinucleotide biosynthesis protein A
MRGLVEALRVRTVDADDIDEFGDHRRLLANINTPADYRNLGTRHGFEPPS